MANVVVVGSHDIFDKGMPGLVLRMNYGGRKTWRALYYVKKVVNDKHRTEPRTHPLGIYPILNLKEAREKARQFLVDPAKALAQSDAGSFGEVAANFIKRHVEAKQLRSKPEIERCLAKYILPRWQHRPFHEINRSDVTALLDQIEDNHGAWQADMCLSIISKMSRWYQTRNNDYLSPVVPGMRRVNARDRARDRILTDDEIRALWQACEGMGTFGGICRVLLLTGSRLAKVATMQHEDINGDGVWTIATTDREKGNPGVLKLPKLALDIIKAQPILADNPFVFPGQRRKASDTVMSFNSFSQGKADLIRSSPPTCLDG
jgi:integrase